MDMGVGEVAGTHRDEVAGRAQVRLEVGDDRTVLGHRQRDLHLAAVADVGSHGDLVAVDAGDVGRFGEGGGCVVAGDRQVSAERETRTVGDVEVRHRAIRARRQRRQLDRPGPVGRPRRVHVVENRELAVDHDEVKVLLVLRGEVEHRRSLGPFDHEPERAALGGELTVRGHEPVALCRGDDAFAHGGGGHRLLGGSRRSEHRPGSDPDREHAGEHDTEQGETLDGVHDARSRCARSGRRSAGTAIGANALTFAPPVLPAG
jgi:hypothetical protein